MASPAESAGRTEARALDLADPLRAFRDRFLVADGKLVYLDGNSLGRLPLDTVARLAQVAELEWGERLIRSWGERWMELPERLDDGVSLQAGERGTRRTTRAERDRHRPRQLPDRPLRAREPRLRASSEDS